MAAVGEAQAAAIEPRSARPPSSRRLGSLVVLIALLAVWEGLVALLRLPFFIVPPPSKILAALWVGLTTDPSSRAGFTMHIVQTLTEALGGFVIGSTLGIALGAILAEFRVVERYAMPYVTAFQAIPKIAVAPLLVIWFGLGIESKILLVVLITFFPLAINTLAGLKSVEAERIELMTSLCASRGQTFWLVKLPSALPFVFAGLYQGILNSLVGAVVSEFVAAQRGLGVLIQELTLRMSIDGVYAVLIVLGILGVALGQLVSLARAKVLFWAPSARGRGR